jgi:hypothetical protein
MLVPCFFGLLNLQEKGREGERGEGKGERKVREGRRTSPNPHIPLMENLVEHILLQRSTHHEPIERYLAPPTSVEKWLLNRFFCMVCLCFL